MKVLNILFAALLMAGFASTGLEAKSKGKNKGGGPAKGFSKKAGKPKKGWGNPGGVPPGLAKKGHAPPGLAKKGGLPPGIAKKYGLGDRIPRSVYHPIEDIYRARLPYNSPAGRRWVRAGRDLYLLSEATGTVVDVVQGWLEP